MPLYPNFILGAIVGISVFSRVPPKDFIDIGIYIASIGALATYWYISAIFMVKRNSIVYLKQSINDLTFLERNSDLIIVAILGGVAAGLLLLVIEHLLP
ncbi:MAG: hypothetical protein ABFC38_12045 [Methanospirillum sp.]